MLAYIQNDTTKKFGITLYSESELLRLQQQKKVEQMTVADFEIYVARLINFREGLDSLSERTAPANDLLYYSYSMIRVLIAEVGYNPLFTNSQYEAMIIRFRNDPKTKPLVNKLMK